MSSSPEKSASDNRAPEVEESLDRTVLIGELIVCEAERLAEVCQRTKSIEPLERMEWTLQDAMEQIGNQICNLKYGCDISDKQALTDQNGGQGDE